MYMYMYVYIYIYIHVVSNIAPLCLSLAQPSHFSDLPAAGYAKAFHPDDPEAVTEALPLGSSFRRF